MYTLRETSCFLSKNYNIFFHKLKIIKTFFSLGCSYNYTRFFILTKINKILPTFMSNKIAMLHIVHNCSPKSLICEGKTEGVNDMEWKTYTGRRSYCYCNILWHIRLIEANLKFMRHDDYYL